MVACKTLQALWDLDYKSNYIGEIDKKLSVLFKISIYHFKLLQA